MQTPAIRRVYCPECSTTVLAEKNRPWHCPGCTKHKDGWVVRFNKDKEGAFIVTGEGSSKRIVNLQFVSAGAPDFSRLPAAAAAPVAAPAHAAAPTTGGGADVAKLAQDYQRLALEVATLRAELDALRRGLAAVATPPPRP